MGRTYCPSGVLVLAAAAGFAFVLPLATAFTVGAPQAAAGTYTDGSYLAVEFSTSGVSGQLYTRAGGSCTVNDSPNVVLVDLGSGNYALNYTILAADNNCQGTCRVQCELNDSSGSVELSTTALADVNVRSHLPTISGLTNLNGAGATLRVGLSVRYNLTLDQPIQGLTGTCTVGTIANGAALAIHAYAGDASQYYVQHIVVEGDPDVRTGGSTSYLCDYADAFGHSVNGVTGTTTKTLVDGNTPRITSLAVAHTSDVPARIGTVITFTISIAVAEESVSGSCSVNGNPNPISFSVTGDPTISSWPIRYTVAEGDTDTSNIAWSCTITDGAGNSDSATGQVTGQEFNVDAHRPTVISAVVDAATSHLLIGSELQIFLQAQSAPAATVGTCTINSRSLNIVSASNTGSFTVSYTVAEGDPEQLSAGNLTWSCELRDSDGNVGTSHGVLHTPSGGIAQFTVATHSPKVALGADGSIRSTRYPTANIGSHISIELQTSDGSMAQDQPLTIVPNECLVDGSASSNDISIVPEPDTRYYLLVADVVDGGKDVSMGSNISINCLVQNAQQNTVRLVGSRAISFAIDANAPHVSSVAITTPKDANSYISVGDPLAVTITTTAREQGVTTTGCHINGIDVRSSFHPSSPTGAYMVSTTVTKPFDAGQLAIDCVLQDVSGNTYKITRFTDDNHLEGRVVTKTKITLSNLADAYVPNIKIIVAYTLMCVVSFHVGKLFPSFKMPKITGYLIMGIIAGPFVLNLIPREEIRSLRSVDEISLAFIAIAAGAKLYLKKLRKIWKAILSICGFLILFEYVMGFGAVMAVRTTFDYLSSMEADNQVAIALLAGAMMIARSPSSALAIVSETRASGLFTDVVLGVTILSDVAVLLLYNVNDLIADAMLEGSSTGGQTTLALASRIVLAIVVGAPVAILARFTLFRAPSISRKSFFYPVEKTIRHSCLLAFGLSVYVVANLLDPWVDALLTCMVVGVVLANFSHHRHELMRMITRMDQYIYCAFFTLTGASLQIDMLGHAIAISVVLAVTRIIAIMAGAYAGGKLVQQTSRQACYSGCCYITQAGVTLGLAKEVHLNYPGWGGYFATMIIATVVLNQLLGPPLMRWALRRIGDARRGDSANSERVVIFRDHAASSRPVDSLVLMGWEIVHGGLESVGDGSLRVASALRASRADPGSSGSVAAPKDVESGDHKVSTDDVSLLDAQGGVEKHVKQLLLSNEPINIVLVQFSNAEETTQLIRTIATACADLGRSEIMHIVVPVDKRGRNEAVGTVPECLRGALPAEIDAVDIIFVEGSDAVPMLFDMTVPGLRHRMQRERRGKQRFLPKRDYDDVPLNEPDVPKAPTDGTEIEMARVGGDEATKDQAAGGDDISGVI